MKISKFLPTLIAPLMLAPALTSCGGDGTDANTINIICYSASYGDGWIKEIKDRFIVDHPGVTVNISALYEAESLIERHLESRKNDDDLYISVSTNWKSYAAQNYFAELDSFLEETVDGTTVKNKVSDEYADSIYFTKSNGDKHCYRLPWTSGIGGIFYNTVMFANNGWDTWLKETYPTNTSGTPETFPQLLALCDKINSDRVPAGSDGLTSVKPFAYSGANTDYFDYTVFNWWGQIAGKDAIQDFLKYENASNYDVTQNSTYAALKTATGKWNQIFSNSANYIANSNNKSAGDAQKEFVNGYAAMMFNGDWLYNDSLQYTNEGSYDDSFNLGLMKTPVLEEATNANYVNTSYIIGEDQYIAIPKSSKRQGLAKEFIKAMISNDGCKTFANKAHGFLAYDATFAEGDITDDFLKSAIALRSSFTDKFTNFSSNRKYLCNYIDIWCTGSLRPFLSILNGSQTSLDTAFTNIATTASSQWTYWTNQSR